MYLNQFYVMFIVYNNLFVTRRNRIIQSLNEVIVLLTVYHLFCFTDFVQDAEARSVAVGNSMLGMTFLNLAVNLVPVLVDLLFNVKQRI